jgi:carbon starvation protein CstA
VLWNYFSWMNQVLAAIVLWAATIFLLKTARRKAYSLVTALPAMFMMMVSITFILFSSQGLGLDYTLSLCIASVITFITVLAYIRDVLREPGAAVTSG